MASALNAAAGALAHVGRRTIHAAGLKEWQHRGIWAVPVCARARKCVQVCVRVLGFCVRAQKGCLGAPCMQGLARVCTQQPAHAHNRGRRRMVEAVAAGRRQARGASSACKAPALVGAIYL